MADTESKLNIASLDFDNIKNNLKTFLRSQSEFSDYNFEGSGLSVLLDVLAYNTHYMGYYLNMLANEMFIDTATLRSSVVSHAKLVGYTPRSIVSSKALINLSFTGSTTGTTLTIPRFTRFLSSEKDGFNYLFTTTEQLTLTQNSTGGFTATGVEIKEGQPQSYTFTHNQQLNEKQIFVLPDSNIDTTTVQVQVQTSAQKTNRTTFTLAENSTGVESTSEVFYIEENRDGKYQIYFGNDIIGKKLSDGNIVIVTYLVSSGNDANGITIFRLIDQVDGMTATVSTMSESSAGAGAESINDIKALAPKSFVSQNRAVTRNDYIALIKRLYPSFSAITVWGGEENDPPIFGKIFFSVRPVGDYNITQTEINNVIENVIKPYSILTVKPEYVAPDYNYINFDVNVVYDPTKTSLTAGQLSTLVRDTVLNYTEANFIGFDTIYKNSKIVREIDNANRAIDNNEVFVSLEKRFRPTLNQARNYILDFGVPLSPGTSGKKIYGVTNFRYFDNAGVLRECIIEEVPQSYTGIFSVQINNSGTNYSSEPTLTVSGDGTGAVLKPVIINGRIARVEVVNPGSDYTTAIITVSGGGGSGAILTPKLNATQGKMRIFYYDTNKIKKIVNDNAGTIYYDTGVVQLNSFNPNLIRDALGTMVVKAYPRDKVFSFKKNQILTLDYTDTSAVSVRVSPTKR